MDTNNTNTTGKTNSNGGALFAAKPNAGFGKDAFKDLYKNVKAKEAAANSRENTLEGVKMIFKEQDERKKKLDESMYKINELAKKQREEKKEKEIERRKAEAADKIDEEYSTTREEAFKSLLKNLKGLEQA